MIYEIEPLVGNKVINFDMMEDEVVAAEGQPIRRYFKKDCLILQYSVTRYHIDKAGVCEINIFGPDGDEFFYKSINIFANPEHFLEQICTDCVDVWEELGFLHFNSLGMLATGFHDGDVSQLAVTLLSSRRQHLSEADKSNAKRFTM